MDEGNKVEVTNARKREPHLIPRLTELGFELTQTVGTLLQTLVLVDERCFSLGSKQSLVDFLQPSSCSAANIQDYPQDTHTHTHKNSTRYFVASTRPY